MDNDLGPIAQRERIRTIVAKSGRLLDGRSFEDYVKLFTTDGAYVLAAESDEIGRNTIWLELDTAGLATLFKESSQHVRDKAHRKHLITTDVIDVAGNDAKAVSTFAVFRTDLAGDSSLYALGSYEDELVVENNEWKLRRRVVTADTRQLRTPTPMPL